MVMTKEELFEYIKNRTYYCKICNDLKQKVLENGLEEINKYDSWICGGVEDMQIRYEETLTGIKFEPVDDKLFEENDEI